MSLARIGKNNTTRRGFVKEVAAGAAGVAVAGALRATLQAPGDGLIAAPGPLVQAPAPGEMKYRKYFTTELKPEELEIGYGAMKNMFMVFCDGDIIEGCHFFSAMLMRAASTENFIGHGPHKHRDPEVLVSLGTDPDHPQELGAEYEIFMGAEMERHVVNKPSLVFIPGGLIHCPFRLIRVTRPFIFIEAQYSPKDVETAYRDMVPADQRSKYIFIDSDGSSEKGKPKPKSKMPPLAK
ncbi:MAG TPA: twin-arginine translocation signal domain-containing protein [Acidobacteriota bacterium]|nr:twin-arginine translocation signal domain-containing protein [Acidobacteriota bacterium]